LDVGGPNVSFVIVSIGVSISSRRVDSVPVVLVAGSVSGRSSPPVVSVNPVPTIPSDCSVISLTTVSREASVPIFVSRYDASSSIVNDLSAFTVSEGPSETHHRRRSESEPLRADLQPVPSIAIAISPTKAVDRDAKIFLEQFCVDQVMEFRFRIVLIVRLVVLFHFRTVLFLSVLVLFHFSLLLIVRVVALVQSRLRLVIRLVILFTFQMLMLVRFVVLFHVRMVLSRFSDNNLGDMKFSPLSRPRFCQFSELKDPVVLLASGKCIAINWLIVLMPFDAFFRFEPMTSTYLHAPKSSAIPELRACRPSLYSIRRDCCQIRATKVD
jgi:hypothetical protein